MSAQTAEKLTPTKRKLQLAKKADKKPIVVFLGEEQRTIVDATRLRTHRSYNNIMSAAVSFCMQHHFFDALTVSEPASVRNARELLAKWGEPTPTASSGKLTPMPKGVVYSEAFVPVRAKRKGGRPKKAHASNPG